MHILGIDIGGSGIKGAIVNTVTGEMVTERHRIPTPQPATPDAVADTVAELVRHFDWHGPIGCGFPAAVVRGEVKTASNIDKSWIGTPVEKLLARSTGCPVYVANDADVAGLAEMNFGAGKGRNGVVLLITIGTGLGSVLFSDGQLVPNTEFGHIYLSNGIKGEHFAADSVRKREELSWEKWGKRFNKYLKTIEALTYPELIILGGGASKKLEKFESELSVKTPIVPAETLNQAGIIGAALYATTRRNA